MEYPTKKKIDMPLEVSIEREKDNYYKIYILHGDSKKRLWSGECYNANSINEKLKSALCDLVDFSFFQSNIFNIEES